jgi:16S rRNA G966 N2-methylase RsmD
VQQNYQKNLAQLAFKKSLVSGYENRFVLDQLYGKQKAKKKFPFLFEKAAILYPAKVSVEQSSSEKTAKWKAQLVTGSSLLDMTGGFGLDSYFFSKSVGAVTYLEQNEALYDIVKHNFEQLGVENIHPVLGDSIAFIKNYSSTFDWIYLDPARRDELGNRKVGLAGYFPNLIEIQSELFTKTEHILVKVSPMLDIQQAIQQLKFVQKVLVIAVQNEVKELLLILKKEKPAQIPFQCVDLKNSGVIIDYQASVLSQQAVLSYSMPRNYIYEPNAAILKAGLFKEVAIDYKVEKLHSNTHLYTADELIDDFPGRKFRCEAVLNFNKKIVKPYLDNGKANISTRNFPYSVAEVRKKLACKAGGNIYLFASTLMNEKLGILVCRKVG